MPDKRKSSGTVAGSSPYAKRARSSYVEDDQDDDEIQRSVTPYERPRNHPVFGQKSAFPGLDIGDADELFYGPADDGIEYLRMLANEARSEANSLPILFTAPAITEPPSETIEVPEEIKEAQVKNTAQEEEKEEKEEGQNPPARVRKGFYSDGVYISLTKPETTTDEGYSDAQASYYNLLHHRFLLLRSILKCTPPSETIAALDDSHPISLPQRSKTARKEWRRLLLTVDPQTVQLACMDMDSVLGVLGIVARLMSENVRSGNVVLVRRIGAWAWGLLGKCRDVGQLGTEEVGEIRDLGKRAAKILRKMREEEEEEEEGYESDLENDLEDHPQAENEGNGDIVDDQTDQTIAPDLEKPAAEEEMETETDATKLESAKMRLQSQISGAGNTPPALEATKEEELLIDDEDNGVDVSTQTRAMLDMIITVVGEHYRQRDLLEAREMWTASEGFF